MRTERSVERLLSAVLIGLVAATSTGRAEPKRPDHVTPEIERAIERGTQYLTRTQNRDGSWNNMGGWGSYPTAMTALAGTALLVTGSTPTRGPHCRALRKSVDFVLRVSQPNGLIATRGEEGRSLHGHGFALLFLAQAYGMEEDRRKQQAIHDVLVRGVRITERSQSRAGGWLYSPSSDGDEGSVTVTQIQGLRACRNAGIFVEPTVVRGAVRYIERSANPDGGIRYQLSGGGGSRPPITAAAVATLYNAGAYDSPLALKALAYCDRTITAHGGGGVWGHTFYAHFYLAQAKFQRGGREWARYYRDISRWLLSKQSSDGSWMGDGVGTVYGTSIAVVILALPYQRLPIYQR